jgi:hypothetical protein
VSRTRALAVAVALALAVTGCSRGGDDDDEAKPDDTETSARSLVKATVSLDVSRSELVSPHKEFGPLEASTRDAVAGVVEELLLITSAKPLVEGKAGGGFADLFTPDAGAKAANADRDAFFDEGLPPFGDLEQVEARVGMTGLEGSDAAATSLVIAKFVWNVASTEDPDDVVNRIGELSLVRVDDAWKIGAYAIVVTRTIDEETTTTTATTR